MTERQRDALEKLERSMQATTQTESKTAFANFSGAIGKLGRLGELEGIGPLAVPPAPLRSWIANRIDELQLDSGQDLYLGRTLAYRSDFAFLCDVSKDIPKDVYLSADGWNEKIRCAWRDDGWDRVPEGIPESHWWWFPEFRNTDVFEKPRELDLPPGDLCEAVRSLSGSLHVDQQQTLEVLVRNQLDDISPLERRGAGSPGDLLLARLREAVKRGHCSTHARGSRVDCVFADRRLDATVHVEGGRASLGWFEPRAHVVIDEDVASLGESIELLRRAVTTEPYPRRRLLVTEFFDRMGSIFRVCPRDERLESRDGLVATFEEVPLEVVSGWAMRCSLRLGGRPEHEAQQMREDRSAVEFLHDLVGEGDLWEALDMQFAVEYWDEDLRETLETAKRCPIPEGTPESHWWWREGV